MSIFICQWQKWQYNTIQSIQYNKRIQKATIKQKTLKAKQKIWSYVVKNKSTYWMT